MTADTAKLVSPLVDDLEELAVVFMGFEAPEEGDEQSFCQRMDQWAADLRRVVFVHSIGGMSLES